MKRFLTTTIFMPLSYKEDEGFQPIIKGDGKAREIKRFKTRKAVEVFCRKNKCAYVEQKNIFYK